jgi:hypothetical protein
MRHFVLLDSLRVGNDDAVDCWTLGPLGTLPSFSKVF